MVACHTVCAGHTTKKPFYDALITIPNIKKNNILALTFSIPLSPSLSSRLSSLSRSHPCCPTSLSSDVPLLTHHIPRSSSKLTMTVGGGSTRWWADNVGDGYPL